MHYIVATAKKVVNRGPHSWPYHNSLVPITYFVQILDHYRSNLMVFVERNSSVPLHTGFRTVAERKIMPLRMSCGRLRIDHHSGESTAKTAGRTYIIWVAG